MTGRPARDREQERARAEEALAHYLDSSHATRKLEGHEADLLHRMFSSVPEAYDAWEYETH